MSMTREEFAARWDSDEDGGGITVNEIADCAKAWGVFTTPRIHPIRVVINAVVKESGART